MDPYLTTRSLRKLPIGASITRILKAALLAVEPGQSVKRWMVREKNKLTIAGKIYFLDQYHRVLIVSIGKAAVPMGAACIEVFGSFFSEGILLTKTGYAKNLVDPTRMSGLQILEAGHPLPDERGVRGATSITKLLTSADKDDLVVFLISGGGSALLTSPAVGISLADLQSLTSTLLACGATIHQINSLRKHLDTLKGGGLTRLAAPATMITLVLSDVVSDPLDMIASGPSVPDPTTYKDAVDVLKQYGILDQVPPSILNRLDSGLRGEIPETPKPGEPIFEYAQYVIVGNNRQAAEAAQSQAQKEGFNALILTTSLEGEAREAGRWLSVTAREIATSGKPLSRPACVIAGGETTVTLQGTGLGGRNQELALGTVDGLAGLENVALVTLATDGGDGPTDAAGAVVTGETQMYAKQKGLDAKDYLARNDSYYFFEPLNDLLKTGPTQTNVNDLALLFVY